MLGIGAGNSWAQVLIDIKDLVGVVTSESDDARIVTNPAGIKYVSNGQFVWPAELDANVITVGNKNFLRLKMSNPETNHLKIQFAEGKIHAGDHLIMEVARVNVADQTSDLPGLGFTIVKQATNNNQPSYSVPQDGYPGTQITYENSSSTTQTYKIDYILKEDDINNVGVNLQNIVISGYWWDATAINRIMVVRHSDEESLPEISVIAPTSNTLTLAPDQQYTLKAKVSGGEYKPGIVWRSYTSATPQSQHVGTDPHYLNDATEWTYTAPTTPGTYYIGADAQQLCVDKDENGKDRYEGSKPYVITVTVVDHDLPKISVSAPTTKTITLGVGQKYIFSATASDGENNRGVVWRQYNSATPQYTWVGVDGSIDGTDKYGNNYEYTAPTTPGTYYIGADAQHQLSDNSYKSSTPYVVTVNVVEHTAPGIIVEAPTSNTLELVAGQTYVFKAHTSGGEGNPTVVWRQYHSATPQYTYVGNNGSIETLSYDDELTYTAPTTTGTYYIGADAQQLCVESGKYEGSAPHVITVKVVERPKPEISVLAPTMKSISLAPGASYTFKAEALGGVNPGVVWRQYYNATPAYTYTTTGDNKTGSITTLSYENDFTWTAPEGTGTYYIGADAQQPIGNEEYEGSAPYVITVNVCKPGAVNYNNRLAVQWNFDICDQYRFVASQMNSSHWTMTKTTSGIYETRTYSYNQALGTSGNDTQTSSYSELTYDGTSVIPVAAGLKFKAAANTVKIKAELANGKVRSIHLVVGNGVKMYIPYVENTFRNDMNSDARPNDGIDNETGVFDEKTKNLDDFINCLHHIKRDILYVALEDATSFLRNGVIKNECINLEGQSVLNDAGVENVNGKQFYKANYTGVNGTPCILQFTKETSIDRIGVNRNLTSSFYTQYSYEQKVVKPQPSMRVVSGIDGGRLEGGEGGTWTSTPNAMAMTYGGWKNNAGSYGYTAYDGTSVTDEWSDLDETAGASSIAVDGFSVISRNTVAPTSESLMPEKSEGGVYHPASEGLFNTIGNVFKTNYIENFTPWTLPCRGGYLKFEPTLPGVLNVHVFQKGGKRYYIADEFGNPVSENVFCKTTSKNDVDDRYYAGFRTNNDSYVKYSFNVYPGKTYYMFSSEAGIGFAGYYFEPYVYRSSATVELARQDMELATLTLNDGVDYSTVTKPTTSTTIVQSPKVGGGYVEYPITKDNRAVAVTLNRSFAANTWNSICLPFSMNKNAMEEVFGEGTRVVLLRDVQDKANMSSGLTTANFIAHENQDIIAGYPYFILPTKAVEKITTNAYIPTTTASIPVISGKGFKTTTGISIASENYGGMEEYSFTGTLTGVTAPQGSYYMNTSGSLSRCTKTAGVALKPYRAYISFSGTYESAKALDSVFFGNPDDKLNEDEATGVEEISIENVLFKNGILTQSANVYNMQGQIIRQNVTNLQGLPKGAYIVNGKKFVIK